MNKIKNSGPIFIIVAALLWSFDGILRRNLYTLPPSTVVFFEHVLGLVLLTPIMWNKFSEIKTLKGKEWLAIIIVSLFSGALGTIFYTAALGMVQYVQFSVVVLLQQLQPIWAILTAAILLKEKITKQFVIWSVTAIVGSYFVTFKDLHVNVLSNNGTLIATVLATLAGVMWATSTSFSKIVLNKTSHITATFLRFLIAPIFALIFIVVLKQAPSLTHVNSSQWTSLILITLSTGMVALVLYYFGLKKTPARVSAICELTWPVSAIFIDYFFFKSNFTVTQILGTIAVLISIYKVSAFRK